MRTALSIASAILLMPTAARAQQATPEEPTRPTPPTEPPPPAPTTLEVYGFTMLDLGYDFGKIGDPDWQDVLRPTKLPAFPNEFGKGGRWFEGVRQSRFGVNWTLPTSYGDLKTKFEFEMFGVGVDAGQTTIRLRHAVGEWHNLRAGQTWSPFMDPDVFPDEIEYWGPPGMVFFRNVQLAYSFYKTDTSDVTLAIERPGASADAKPIEQSFDLTNVVPRFPVPDISADAKIGGPWGHFRLAGILRYMRWDDLSESPTVEGHVWGWGVNASANIKLKPALFKLQAVYGSAIENYMNDAGPDVAPKSIDPPVPQTVEGEGIRILGLLGFVDIKWCDLATSSVGYSYVWMDNTPGQLGDAFHISHYAIGNILFHPVDKLMLGPEFQFGRRENNDHVFSPNDYRIQFSVKFSFDQKIGGG